MINRSLKSCSTARASKASRYRDWSSRAWFRRWYNSQEPRVDDGEYELAFIMMVSIKNLRCGFKRRKRELDILWAGCSVARVSFVTLEGDLR